MGFSGLTSSVFMPTIHAFWFVAFGAADRIAISSEPPAILTWPSRMPSVIAWLMSTSRQSLDTSESNGLLAVDVGPRAAWMMPAASILTLVDLPTPFSATGARTSAARIGKADPRTAVPPPNDLLMSRTINIGVADDDGIFDLQL